MTQFIMMQTAVALRIPPGIVLVTAPPGSHAEAVARDYFGASTTARLVVGWSGTAEPLVDAIWEAQRSGADVAKTRLGRMFDVLVATDTPFVCWWGADSFQLPVARTRQDVLRAMLQQTRAQPAHLFLSYPRAV